MDKELEKVLQLNIEGKSDTNRYDDDFAKVPFYQRFPQYYPYVGKNYDRYRILIIAESHYLAKDTKFENNAENFYGSSVEDLSKSDRQMTCIRRVVNNIQKGEVCEGTWKKSRTIWRNITKVLQKYIKDGDEWNLMSYTSVINGFMRPAEKTGKSIKVTAKDVDKSVEVIGELLRILKPRYICFVSKLAHKHIKNKMEDSFEKHGVAEIIRTPHPSSAWWNRKNKKNENGKEIFDNFVQKAVGSNS